VESLRLSRIKQVQYQHENTNALGKINCDGIGENALEKYKIIATNHQP
jgi:hypothetical protein